MAAISAFSAHMIGQYLAVYEPTKLAALELHKTTSKNAPFIYGGVPDKNGNLTGPYIEIPNALSLLACNKADCSVQGLDATPTQQQPPLYIHVLFDIKLFMVAVVLATVALYFALNKWAREWLHKRVMLGAFVAVSWFGVAIVELGWMMTEIGRQPWAVVGHVSTADAFTKSHSVMLIAWLFPAAYVVLFIVTWFALRRIIKDEKTRTGGTL